MLISLLFVMIVGLITYYFQQDQLILIAASFLAMITGIFVESILQGTSLQPTMVKTSPKVRYIPIDNAYYLIEGSKLTGIFGFFVLARPPDLTALARLSGFEFEIHTASTATSILLYIQDDIPNAWKKIPITFVKNAQERANDFHKAIIRLMPGLQLEIMTLNTLAEFLGLPENVDYLNVDSNPNLVAIEHATKYLEPLLQSFPNLKPLHELLALKSIFSHERIMQVIIYMTDFVYQQQKKLDPKAVHKFSQLVANLEEENVDSQICDILHHFEQLFTHDSQNE